MKGRILSGMRPTGRMHLGNYLGALLNWVRMQEEYECFYEVADWHALTTAYDRTEQLREDIQEMVIDWLSVGLDPLRSTIFVQSNVPEHAVLHLLLSMVTPTSWLERNPTLKEMVRDLGLKESVGYGLLGYPVLQAADILIYKADTVPVGEDQLPHLELTREIVRRFNNFYGPVFPEPQALLTEVPLILGSDGKKMSKSLNNYIALSDPPEVVTQKVRMFITDPQKIYKGDPGRPEICPVFHLHRHFSKEEVDQIAADCRSGALGCVDCKANLAQHINTTLEPIREARRKLEGNPGRVWEILEYGREKARKVASATLDEVRRAMKMTYEHTPLRS